MEDKNAFAEVNKFHKHMSPIENIVLCETDDNVKRKLIRNRRFERFCRIFIPRSHTENDKT